MRWTRTLQVVDTHCQGEIGRVVTGGVLDVPGATMGDKLAHFNEVDDSLRRFLTFEPRGGPAGSVVLLTPPTVAGADAGMIVLQSDQAHAMSGSNSICAATALVETGMVAMREPETVVTLDTASGLVRATAHCREGVCEAVSLDMPPAFAAELDAVIETSHWGAVRYDLCYGGIFYALVDVAQLNLKIAPENARKLAEAGARICAEINGSREVRHPELPDINGVAYVMFRDWEPDGAFRQCTTLIPGRVDRSPCGTGTVSNVAAHRARGRAEAGQRFRSRSIIGGEFEAQLMKIVNRHGREECHSRLTGRAYVYGLSQIGLDPRDPFPEGFRLADTWGPLA